MNQINTLPTTDQAPYYLPLADEVEVFEAAYASRLPILLKGPTGCGKTRFVEHMSWLLDSARSRKCAPRSTAADRFLPRRSHLLPTWWGATYSRAMKRSGPTAR
jgi:nitric oxide reductase NorQ protein